MSDTGWRRDGEVLVTFPPARASGGQGDSDAAPEAAEDTQTRGQRRGFSRTGTGPGPGSSADRSSESPVMSQYQLA